MMDEHMAAAYCDAPWSAASAIEPEVEIGGIMKQERFYFSGQRFGTMTYLVYPGHYSRAQRVDGTCLGVIEATYGGRRNYNSSRGRNRNGYRARAFNPMWSVKIPGVYPSRKAAAEAIVDYLSQFKYGRKRLERVGFKPTKPLKQRYSLQPGWPHAMNAALSRLLRKQEPDSYEVLAEAEGSWEVRLDWLGDVPNSEVWSYRTGRGTQYISITVKEAA